MDKVTSYIKECETEFMQLLGLTYFPVYEIVYKEISLSVSAEQGYDSLGAAHYDYRTGKHTLIVWSNIHTLGEVGKQTIFHEFTHILDDETYVNKDPEKYIANHGFTEYHAAQIGFLKVLGVKSIKQNISFSMSDFIDTESGYMSIQDYVDTPLLLANELIGRINFPTDFKMLKDIMGVIFNYFGRRSICKMYSKDYKDNTDTSTIEKILTHAMCDFLKAYLIGVLTNQKIAVLGKFYKDMFFALVKRPQV